MSALLGKLDWSALPFLEAWRNPTASTLIAAAAAGVVVLGVVATVVLLTRFRLWHVLWRD